MAGEVTVSDLARSAGMSVTGSAGLSVPGPHNAEVAAYADADEQKVWFTILDERPGIAEITVHLRSERAPMRRVSVVV